MGARIAVSGTAPIAPDGSTAHPGDMYGQTLRCLEIIREAIVKAGGGLDDAIRTRVYLTDVERWQDAASVHGKIFGDICPACPFIAVNRLIDPDWLVEIEAEAVTQHAESRARQRQAGMTRQHPDGAALSRNSHLGVEPEAPITLCW